MVQYQNTTLLFHNFGEDAQNSLLVSSEDEPGVSLHSMFTHPLRTLWSSLANQATAVAQEVAWLCKVISVGLWLLDAQTSRGMPGQDEPGSTLKSMFAHPFGTFCSSLAKQATAVAQEAAWLSMLSGGVMAEQPKVTPSHSSEEHSTRSIITVGFHCLVHNLPQMAQKPSSSSPFPLHRPRKARYSRFGLQEQPAVPRGPA
jgi:hypothetical protein